MTKVTGISLIGQQFKIDTHIDYENALTLEVEFGNRTESSITW